MKTDFKMSDVLSIMFSLSLILIRMKRFSLSGCFVCPEMRLEQHAGVLAYKSLFIAFSAQCERKTSFHQIKWCLHTMVDSPEKSLMHKREHPSPHPIPIQLQGETVGSALTKCHHACRCDSN